MNIKQFRYAKGNLSYLLWSGNEAIVIDGGAVEEILKFISEKNLYLKIVTNTHGHDDHTPGNKSLLEQSQAEFISASNLEDQSIIRLGDESLRIIYTPGHTMDSIVFSYDNVLITGDTLFNGTVGNCYTKNYELYFQSLKKLTSLPEYSIIYAGHDLFDYATGVIHKIDPENSYLKGYKNAYKRDHVCSTLADELKVNPFIRFNDPDLDDFRASLNMPLDSEYQRWRAVMSVH